LVSQILLKGLRKAIRSAGFDACSVTDFQVGKCERGHPGRRFGIAPSRKRGDAATNERRIVFCRIADLQSAGLRPSQRVARSSHPQNAILRYSRFKICATRNRRGSQQFRPMFESPHYAGPFAHLANFPC
jgi:hypothetical protein